jgi:hypothetical protein
LNRGPTDYEQERLLEDLKALENYSSDDEFVAVLRRLIVQFAAFCGYGYAIDSQETISIFVDGGNSSHDGIRRGANPYPPISFEHFYCDLGL